MKNTLKTLNTLVKLNPSLIAHMTNDSYKSGKIITRANLNSLGIFYLKYDFDLSTDTDINLKQLKRAHDYAARAALITEEMVVAAFS